MKAETLNVTWFLPDMHTYVLHTFSGLRFVTPRHCCGVHNWNSFFVCLEFSFSNCSTILFCNCWGSSFIRLGLQSHNACPASLHLGSTLSQWATSVIFYHLYISKGARNVKCWHKSQSYAGLVYTMCCTITETEASRVILDEPWESFEQTVDEV